MFEGFKFDSTFWCTEYFFFMKAAFPNCSQKFILNILGQNALPNIFLNSIY